MKTNRFQEGRL